MQDRANHGQTRRLRSASRIALAGAASAALAGCSAVPQSINPVSWWHDLEGGPIASERPPAPGAADPYPNLATVPAKPAPSDPKQRTALSSALIGDRTNAQYAAAQAPLAPFPAATPTAAPPPVRPPNPAPAPPEDTAAPAASATLEAATAPPLPPQAPPPKPQAKQAASPQAKPQTSPAAAPETPPPEAAIMPPGAVAGTALDDQSAMPPLPDGPPPAPVLRGATTMPIPAPLPVAPVKPPAPPVARPPITIAFPPGSAILPPDQIGALKTLAGQRGSGSFLVAGFGDTASPDPGAQLAGVQLALARAQAIAFVLTGAGVPASAVTLNAEPSGHGAAARLIN